MWYINLIVNDEFHTLTFWENKPEMFRALRSIKEGIKKLGFSEVFVYRFNDKYFWSKYDLTKTPFIVWEPFNFELLGRVHL